MEYTDELIEYAKLTPEQTGLPVTIYVDDGGAYIRNKHQLWVLIQNNYNNKSDVFPIIIEYKKEQIEYKEIKISKNDLNNILKFITNNKNLLIDLANDKISHINFYNKIVKNK